MRLVFRAQHKTPVHEMNLCAKQVQCSERNTRAVDEVHGVPKGTLTLNRAERIRMGQAGPAGAPRQVFWGGEESRRSTIREVFVPTRTRNGTRSRRMFRWTESI